MSVPQYKVTFRHHLVGAEGGDKPDFDLGLRAELVLTRGITMELEESKDPKNVQAMYINLREQLYKEIYGEVTEVFERVVQMVDKDSAELTMLCSRFGKLVTGDVC